MAENQKRIILSCSKRKKKKKPWEIKSSEKAYFHQEHIFHFKQNQEQNIQNFQVVSKQVYVGEIYYEHQKLFETMTNHVNTLHIQAREFESDKRTFQNELCWYIKQWVTSVNTKMSQKAWWLCWQLLFILTIK